MSAASHRRRGARSRAVDANTHTDDAPPRSRSSARLEAAGCEIVRLAVPNLVAARALPEIWRGTGLPLVADIHFDYRLALAAAEAGSRSASTPATSAVRERVRTVARPAASGASPSASA